MTIPDYIPMLCRGRSRHPKDGLCLVQLANWLANPDCWDDDAMYVDRRLREHAVMINDAVDADYRRQLALLAPRLSGTREPGSAQRVLSLSQWMRRNPNPVSVDWTMREGSLGSFSLVPGYVIRGSQQAAVDWLFALVAEFERLTDRKPVELPVEKWDEVRELISA